MLKNYLIVAWRNLQRNRAVSFINIFGLSIGMAVTILIGLWIWDEYSFNRSFESYDRIASLWLEAKTPKEVYDFALLVLIALLIAMPIAGYFMSVWLRTYHLHTAISWWIFAGTAFGALGLTLLTVSFQSIKAAMTNPARILRSE